MEQKIVCLCVLICIQLSSAIAQPTLSSSLTPPSICSGNTFSYLPLSSSNNVGYTWIMIPASGITATSTSGQGSISDTLKNATELPITVTFQFTLTSGAVTNTQNVTLVVKPSPVTSFTVSNTSECLTGNSFAFTNTSISASSNVQYGWFFGDGATSSLENVTHSFTTAGTFLIAFECKNNSYNCTTETFKNIVVNPQPVADFTYSLAVPYSTDGYQFSNTSAGGASAITSYSWNFGDGSPVSTSVNPLHTFVPPGNYPVSLTVVDAQGCSTTAIEDLTTPSRTAAGVAGFWIGNSLGSNNTSGQCVNGEFYFTDQSSANLPSSISSINWNFGDMSPVSNSLNPTHIYTAPGTYIVTETVVFIGGAAGTAQVTQTINVYPSPTLTLLPNLDQVLCAGTNSSAVYFQPIQDALQFNWLITNPAIGTSSGTGNNFPVFKATNSTTNPISSNVQVTAVSPYGCVIAGQTFSITVKALPSITDSLVPQSGCSGTVITMTIDTGSIPGTVFNWTNSNPVLGLATSGSGNVQSFTSNNFNSDAASGFIKVTPVFNGCTGISRGAAYTVYPVPILDSTQSNDTICSGSTFKFTPFSNTTGTTFNWTRPTIVGIQEGSTAGTGSISEVLTNQTPNPIIVPYQYSLQASHCGNVQTVNVLVSPIPTLSSNLIPSPLCNGTMFIYTPTSATNSTMFTWTRNAVNGINNLAGTGIGGINETLVSSLAEPITVIYQYLLLSSGCSNTQDINLVINPVPTISLPSDSQIICSGASTLQISPIVTPSNTPISWVNNNTSIGILATGTGDISSFNALNSGATPISASIQYTAQTTAGCISNTSANYLITVNPDPIANVTSIPEMLLCPGETVSLQASGGNSYQWSMSGTTINGATNSEWDASFPGQYTVTAYNTYGCPDTAGTSVSLIPVPTASFVFNSSCLDTPIDFTNTSSEINGLSVNYIWSDNNGNTSLMESPIFTYSISGNYIVKLVAVPEGCISRADTTSQTIVISRPLQGVTLPTEFIEAGSATALEARSFPGATYIWYPATGLTSSTLSDPLAILTLPQEFTITMTLESGCVTKDTLNVAISPKNVVFIPNAFSPNGDGKNDLFIIAGITSYPGSSLAVFNRYGKQVYYAASYQNDWDGRNLQSGTYIYMLQLNTPNGYKLLKGSVEILR